MVPALPQAVIDEMAKREHRLRHMLWHGVREVWLNPLFTDEAKQAILAIDPGWEPPRPSLDANGVPFRDGIVGEDFLYMHRQMIATVNHILATVADPSYPKIEGWPQIPPPSDSDYPVPPHPITPERNLSRVKSAYGYYTSLVPWEGWFTDETYLKNATLGQLGADIEYTIHGWLHMRWATPTAVGATGFRPNQPLIAPVDSMWDQPAYDYLGDTYSSHVNPIFWKLHGWIDDRIEDWKHANGMTGDIPWQGTWLGPMGHGPHRDSLAIFRSAAAADEIEGLQRAVSVLAEATGFDGFFADPGPHPRAGWGGGN